MKYLITCFLLCSITGFSVAQEVTLYTPNEYSKRIDIQTESYQFYEFHKLHALRFAYQQPVGKRHLFRLDVPVMVSDFAEREAFLGIGDARLQYSFQVLEPEVLRNIVKSWAVNFNVFIPIGNPDKGLGAGDWNFIFGALADFRIAQNFSLIPEINYIHSFTKTNVLPIPAKTWLMPTPGDLDGIVTDDYLKSFGSALSIVYLIPSINSWARLGIYSVENLQAEVRSSNLRVEYGLRFKENVGVSVDSYWYISHEKYLRYLFNLNFNFYL